MLDSKLLKAIRALGKTEISWLSKCLSQADSLLESAKGGKRLSNALNSAKSFFSTKATGHSSSESDDPVKDLQNIIRILANVGTALNLCLKPARNRKASPEQEKSCILPCFLEKRSSRPSPQSEKTAASRGADYRKISTALSLIASLRRILNSSEVSSRMRQGTLQDMNFVRPSALATFKITEWASLSSS